LNFFREDNKNVEPSAAEDGGGAVEEGGEYQEDIRVPGRGGYQGNCDGNACYVPNNAMTVFISCHKIPLQKFVLDTQCSDCLLLGFSNERGNPYREKSWSCQII